MNIPSILSKSIISQLWNRYVSSINSFPHININPYIVFDHIAILDLGAPFSNRSTLSDIFMEIGFNINGSGYLDEKKNNFLWMSHNTCKGISCYDAIPQIVLGDFRLQELSSNVQNIIEKYATQQTPFDFKSLKNLISDKNIYLASNLICNYLCSRQWPMITPEEYQTVKKENALLAWLLLFGREVNHFGIDIQLSTNYKSLHDFNDSIYSILNTSNGSIKGNKSCMIEQSSSLGAITDFNTTHGIITCRGPFLEFVWRHSETSTPKLWEDYYRGFIPKNADKIIESVYI